LGRLTFLFFVPFLSIDVPRKRQLIDGSMSFQFRPGWTHHLWSHAVVSALAFFGMIPIRTL
jgi:hypothetical protein